MDSVEQCVEVGLSGCSPPDLSPLRTDQPRAQGIDAPDCLASGFLARPVGLAGNRHFTGFVESKIPCASKTTEGADAAHILRLFVE
jgi:hypothetical protein